MMLPIALKPDVVALPRNSSSNWSSPPNTDSELGPAFGDQLGCKAGVVALLRS